MADRTLILVIVFFVIIVILVVITVLVVRQEQIEAGRTVIVDPRRPCVRSTDQLVNISQRNCCCIGGQQTDLRYVPSLDVVVSPGPTYYLDACAAFCQDGNFDPTTKTCRTGSSDRFVSCVNLTRPINCDSPAMPVAVDGIEFFYVHSATNAECQASGACAPNANTCPRTAI